MVRSLALLAALVLLLLLSITLAATPQSGAQQPPPTPDLHLLASSPGGLSLEVAVPEPQSARRSPDAAAPEPFLLDGYTIGPEGLPVRELLVGLPPSGAVSLQVEPLAPSRTLSGPAPAIPEPRLAQDPTGLPVQTDWAWQTLPEQPRNLPLASLTEEGFFRDWRVARLRLAPMAYLGDGQWSLTPSFRVQLAFENAPSQDAAAHAEPVAASLSSVVENALLNGEQALAWRSPNAPVLPTTVYTLPQVSWRIPITSDGFYRISYETLDGAGVLASGPVPADVHLLWRGQEVAMQEIGMGDGTFDPGDVFIFYAQKFHGSVQDEKYTDENVYWLVVDDTTPGLRMTTRSAAPGATAQPVTWYTDTVHIEENHVYWARGSSNPVTEATWFWDSVLAKQKPVDLSYPVTLTNLATDPYTGILRVEVASKSIASANPDHHIEVGINGTIVGEDYWDGRVGRVIIVPFPSTLLLEGRNSVDVIVQNDVGRQEVYIDFAEITYRRQTVAQEDRVDLVAPFDGAAAYTLTGFSSDPLFLYDLSDPLRPVLLTDADAGPADSTWSVAFTDSGTAGQPYLALTQDSIPGIGALTQYSPPAGLLSPAKTVDEVIITPQAFYADVLPLATLREAQGREVEVVQVEDLYVLFNGGIFHPRAIRDFLAYALQNWGVAYALLMGDGNFNFKGYAPESYGPPTPVYIPPYLAFLDQWNGEVPVDTWFAQVVGQDTFPDLAVGRVPANSSQQVQDYVAKVAAYEQGPVTGDASNRIMLVADNVPDPDNAGDFEAVLDDLANSYVPPGMLQEKVYMTTYCKPVTDVVTPPPCPSATLALTETWSQGAAMLTYVGHGRVDFWAFELLLQNTQIDTLQNGHYLPFVMTLNCLDGYWMMPPQYPGLVDTRSMAEVSVMGDAYGSIASFSPAGLGTVSSEELMANNMYKAIFQNGSRVLGEIALVGQLTVVTFPSHLPQVSTLFGDPAGWLQMETNPTAITVSSFEVTPGIADGVLVGLLALSLASLVALVALHLAGSDRATR